MLKALTRYAKNIGEAVPEGQTRKPIYKEVQEKPVIIWKGTATEYHSLLVLREAELVLAKAQLTGNDRIDWYIRNKILNLEIKIADLRRWLTEAMGKRTGNESGRNNG